MKWRTLSKWKLFQNNTIKIVKSKQHTQKIYAKHVSDKLNPRIWAKYKDTFHKKDIQMVNKYMEDAWYQ